MYNKNNAVKRVVVQKQTKNERKRNLAVRFIDEEVEIKAYNPDCSVISLTEPHHIDEEYEEKPWYEQEEEEDIPWWEMPDLDEDDELTTMCKKSSKVMQAQEQAEKERIATKIQANVVKCALIWKYKTNLNKMRTKNHSRSNLTNNIVNGKQNEKKILSIEEKISKNHAVDQDNSDEYSCSDISASVCNLGRSQKVFAKFKRLNNIWQEGIHSVAKQQKESNKILCDNFHNDNNKEMMVVFEPIQKNPFHTTGEDYHDEMTYSNENEENQANNFMSYCYDRTDQNAIEVNEDKLIDLPLQTKSDQPHNDRAKKFTSLSWKNATTNWKNKLHNSIQQERLGAIAYDNDATKTSCISNYRQHDQHNVQDHQNQDNCTNNKKTQNHSISKVSQIIKKFNQTNGRKSKLMNIPKNTKSENTNDGKTMYNRKRHELFNVNFMKTKKNVDNISFITVEKSMELRDHVVTNYINMNMKSNNGEKIARRRKDWFTFEKNFQLHENAKDLVSKIDEFLDIFVNQENNDSLSCDSSSSSSTETTSTSASSSVMTAWRNEEQIMFQEDDDENSTFASSESSGDAVKLTFDDINKLPVRENIPYTVVISSPLQIVSNYHDKNQNDSPSTPTRARIVHRAADFASTSRRNKKRSGGRSVNSLITMFERDNQIAQ